MTSTPPVDLVRCAVNLSLRRSGPGVFGVACSGGADSMVLADAAIALAGPAHVVVLTIDHGLRPDSGQVAAGVVAWAEGRGAAAVCERVVVPRRASIEAAARGVRYAALERLADRFGLAAVLTAHTARDQAETVVLRLLRGTGPAGLAGIPGARGRFVRPLLAVPRAAVDAYVAAHALPVWDDPMNDDLALTRARVRHDLLPRLRRENPQLDAALVRLAGAAAEWVAVIDALAAPHARFPIACGALAGAPAAVRKRALALALEAAGLTYDAAQLERLDQLVVAPSRGERAVDLAGGRVRRSYDELALATTPAPPARALIAPPGPYALRLWRPGDRMKLARLNGRSRKLSDLYIDRKLPRAARATARVLIDTTRDVIVWAEHVGIADGVDPALVPHLADPPEVFDDIRLCNPS